MFEGPLREAIHQLKYKGRTSLARPLGQYMGQAWQARPLPADLIVPVPLHPARLRERGYNQATLLADRLARATGLALEERGLQRVRATSPQVDLNAAERKANVQGAFQAEPSRVRGHTIVVVDDVCTTGATLEACSLALQEAGAQRVYAMTLARA